MYINIAIAIPAAVGAVALLHDQSRTADPKLDLPGTVTAVLGLVALVYGFSQAETDGCAAGTTLGYLQQSPRTRQRRHAGPAGHGPLTRPLRPRPKETHMTTNDVLVITGTGGIGQAI